MMTAQVLLVLGTAAVAIALTVLWLRRPAVRRPQELVVLVFPWGPSHHLDTDISLRHLTRVNGDDSTRWKARALCFDLESIMLRVSPEEAMSEFMRALRIAYGETKEEVAERRKRMADGLWRAGDPPEPSLDAATDLFQVVVGGPSALEWQQWVCPVESLPACPYARVVFYTRRRVG